MTDNKRPLTRGMGVNIDDLRRANAEADAAEAVNSLSPQAAFELRCRQADDAVSSWIARQLAAWNEEYAAAHPGFGLTVNEGAGPIITGSLAAVLRFLWSASPQNATVEMVCEQLKRTAMTLLTPIAIAQKPGSLASAPQDKAQ
jgi:hypothetical protein